MYKAHLLLLLLLLLLSSSLKARNPSIRTVRYLYTYIFIFSLSLKHAHTYSHFEGNQKIITRVEKSKYTMGTKKKKSNSRNTNHMIKKKKNY